MPDLYWVGGTAVWDATAGTKWALTSGGAGGQAIPTSADNVFFTNLSTGNVTLGTAAVCKDLDFNGFAGGFAVTTGFTLAVWGLVFRCSTTMTTNHGTSASQTTFKSTSGTCLITMNGKIWPHITFDGVGGTWQLQDNLALSNARTVTLTNGTLDLNGKTVNGNFSSTSANTRELKAAGATWNPNSTAAGTVWNTAVSLTQTGFATLTINILDTGAVNKLLTHAGTSPIGTVNVPADAAPGNTLGTVQFNSLTCNVLNVTGPKYIVFNGSTKAIGTMTFTGTSGNPISLVSITPGTRMIINLTSRGRSQYTDITDVAFRGPTMFAYPGCSQSNSIGLQLADTSRGLLVADGF